MVVIAVCAAGLLLFRRQRRRRPLSRREKAYLVAARRSGPRATGGPAAGGLLLAGPNPLQGQAGWAALGLPSAAGGGFSLAGRFGAAVLQQSVGDDEAHPDDEYLVGRPYLEGAAPARGRRAEAGPGYGDAGAEGVGFVHVRPAGREADLELGHVAKQSAQSVDDSPGAAAVEPAAATEAAAPPVPARARSSASRGALLLEEAAAAVS